MNHHHPKSGLIGEFYARCKQQPQAAALIDGATVISYRELKHLVEEFSRGLIAKGLKAGDRLAIHLKNVPEFAIAYLACLRTGIVAAPLFYKYKGAELKDLLRRLEPSLYLGQKDLYPAIADVENSVLGSDRRVLIDGSADDTSVQSVAAFVAEGSSASLPSSIHADAIQVLLTTSGTTGEPKFAAHTAGGLHSMFSKMGDAIYVCTDVSLTMTTMAHMIGLLNLMATLQAGGTVVLMREFQSDLALDLIERNRCTFLLGLPSMYRALTDAQKTKARTVHSLRLCISGGDLPMPGLQNDFLASFGLRLRNAMGMTEAVGFFTYGYADGPTFRMLDPEHVCFMNAEGVRIQQGETGELALKGPNVFPGYWQSDGSVDRSRKDGWFYTGDLAYEDAEGDCHFVTREKNLIVRASLNVSPIEVERHLAEHPSVREAAVVGAPDPEFGERIIAFAVAEGSASDELARSILQTLSKELADHKVPEQLHFVRELPKTSLGKLDRKALKEQAAALEEQFVSG